MAIIARFNNFINIKFILKISSHFYFEDINSFYLLGGNVLDLEAGIA